jgi:hypothetical protein
MEGSMAGTGKPSIVAAFIVAWGLVGLVPTVAMAQFPIPMIPNFNFGPQHYRSGSSHYSTRSHSRHEEEKQAPVDKTKEKDATQPDPTASASTQQRQQPMSGPPRDTASHDATPSAGPSAAANPPPPQKTNDDQPAFQPSR